MQSLVDYALARNVLESYGDVPQNIRQQLYDEEVISSGRYQKIQTIVSISSLPNLPITITIP